MASTVGFVGPYPPRRSRGRRLLLGIAVVTGLLLGISQLPGLLPGLPNPFASRTIDRSQPAVLKSLVDLREYRATSANYQVLVDVEKDYKWVPSFVRGERTLFVAAGSVDGIVDFGALGPGNVRVSDDRTAVSITLPHARLGDARLDADRSYVYTRNRGLLDRIGGAVGGASTDAALYSRAQHKLAQAAAADPQIRTRAEQNTRATLEQMLRALGFDTVTVTFADPAGRR